MNKILLIVFLSISVLGCKKDKPDESTNKLKITVSDTQSGVSHSLVLLQDDGWTHLFDADIKQGEVITLDVKPGDKIAGNITFNGKGSISGYYNGKNKIIAFNSSNNVITAPILKFTVD